MGPAPSDLGRNVLLPWLDAFQAEHPGIDIRLQLADRVANVYSEPVDAAFRYGKPQDSSLVALPLAADHRRVLCAAPAYLAAHGMPDTPHALAEHQGLCFMLGEDVHDRWRFWDAAGQEVVVRVRSRNVANDGDVVRRWAVLGRGIAYKSYFDAADDLAAGRLVPLCHQLMGQLADKAHGVGDHHVQGVADGQEAGSGVQGIKQAVVGGDPGPGDGV